MYYIRPSPTLEPYHLGSTFKPKKIVFENLDPHWGWPSSKKKKHAVEKLWGKKTVGHSHMPRRKKKWFKIKGNKNLIVLWVQDKEQPTNYPRQIFSENEWKMIQCHFNNNNAWLKQIRQKEKKNTKRGNLSFKQYKRN